MMERIDRWTEAVTQQVSLSRRSFLGRAAGAVMGMAGAAAGLAIARSSREVAAPPTPSTIGACYYVVNGGVQCEEMTQLDCAAITDSDWYANVGCSANRGPA
jgi:hypothetical protein